VARPLPVVDAVTAPYWEAAALGRLLVAECDACARRHAPPEALCPYCRSSWHWATSPGVGEVYSFTVVTRAASPDFDTPYVLALVDLDDGWTMTTNIVGCDPGAVTIGMPVVVEFLRQDDSISLPCFTPRGSGRGPTA
jgi:uncharacterized OB-fold protein